MTYHSCHVCEQCLSSADVAGSFVTSNVLFAGLQSKSVRDIALSILRHTNKSTGQFALQAILATEELSIRQLSVS